MRLSAFVFLVCGCRSVTLEVTKPEFFESDPVKLLKHYDNVETGETTRQTLYESGWDLDSPNVRHMPGPEAMRLMFGDGVFHDGLQSAEKIDALLSELNHYEMVVILYKDVTKKEDIYYFSRKRVHRVGDEISIYFVLKDDLVVYKTRDLNRIDERSVRRAFAEGILKYALPAGAGFAVAKVTD